MDSSKSLWVDDICFSLESIDVLIRQSAAKNVLEKENMPAEIEGLDLQIQRKIVESYMNSINFSLLEILPHLDKNTLKILEIGSGLGVLPMCISREKHVDYITLLDSYTSNVKTARAGFNNEYDYTANPDVVRKFWKENGFSDDYYCYVNIQQEAFPGGKFDLILSRKAWGFHFPIETYLQKSKESLLETGKIIVDIRKQTSGMELLRKNFKRVETVADHLKSCRVLCQEPY